MNEKLQVLAFPKFGAFDNLKEKIKITTQVEDSITQDQSQLRESMAFNRAYFKDFLVK